MIEVNNPMPINAPNQHGWFKSSFSNNANQCVEVRFDDQYVSIRDSKYLRDSANKAAREPIITITATEWTILLDELTGTAKAGANGAVQIVTSPDGATTLRAVDGSVALYFTASEWHMYLAGVRAGEFQPHEHKESCGVSSD
ncbi:MAG: DUF397 domain-containing protein [Actinomycetota bacterium]|nr:DUF397 domain-containing protein [Actinomycetota bacterium]